MKLSLTFAGMNDVKRKLQLANGRARTAVGAGLYGAANNVVTAAKRIVPVDTGTLKGSGYATFPNSRGNNVIVELGFGGAAKDYAVAQHERTDYRHPEGGEAKYLEKPMMEQTSTFSHDVAVIARKAFKANQGAVKGPHPESPWEGGNGQ